ncbi:YicC family protein [Acidisoma cellulosilytica]|uniref:YicC family protein n=1 Tax=Acidisoma cellulosilyticum TaxID=2802395 RepID=A0A964E2C1_9PROT|nr:YicC/YloC family endoribonuclease [Acidisoma cellulosilyticum]MCB8879077.1 YicC family protein [Acidisoma cellulosilyticum]
MDEKQTLASMTGFGAAASTVSTGVAWSWDIRSVNSKGLELRFRMPSGWEAVEAELRPVLTKRLRRGSINANLSLKAEEQGAAAPDPEALERVLKLAQEIAGRIPGSPPLRAELLLGLPGVLRASQSGGLPALTPELKAAVVAGFMEALTQLERGRFEEGARLHTVLTGFLDDIARLRTESEIAAEDQPRLQRARMLENVRALLAEGMSLPEDRVAQEVALLASRSDVREELDRLASHIDAARTLLAEGVLVGRKLDFLMQEFNREANTLCSKSASVPLTAIGLSLKAVIEQLREQVQNVE